MNDNRGIALQVSRRNAKVLTPSNDTLKVKVGSKIDKLTIGDSVSWTEDHGVFYIDSVTDRKNTLARTYRKKTKEIAANVDLVCIIAAMQPLFNTHFVDRCLALASLENIPSLLVVNKKDLGIDNTSSIITAYEKLDTEVILTSANTKAGLEPLIQRLNAEDLKVVVLLGISGVGKSTIFNQLIPQAEQRTSAVSNKTGQGRQTTSQSVGYVYERQSLDDLLLVDLPGIQHFGVSNLDKYEVRHGFLEFVELANACEYDDCLHMAEPNCAIKAALEDNKIAASRYESYLRIIDEIEANREY